MFLPARTRTVNWAGSPVIEHNLRNRPIAKNGRLAGWRPGPRPSSAWSLARPAIVKSQPHDDRFPDADGAEPRTAAEGKSPPPARETAHRPRSRWNLHKARHD